MIIDGHAHASGDFLTSENIISDLDKLGVDKVILVPGKPESKKNYPLPNLAKAFPTKNIVKLTNYLTKFVIKLTGSINQIPKGNEYIFNLTKQNRDRILQFVWITQKIKNPLNYLNKKQIDWKFKGVKLHQCWENYSINSDFFRTIAKWTEENNIPLFIHLFSDTDVKKIIEYKKNHPKLKLIIAHLFGVELFIKANYKDDNLYFDSSTIQVTSTNRLMKTIKFVGASNVLLGSDTPYGKNNLKKNIDRIKNLTISNKEKELILGENMKKILDL